MELLFKLWKNEGKLDETRGWKAERIATELYAKLLGLLLAHWLVLATGWRWAERSLVKLGHAIRAYARLLCLLWTDATWLRRIASLLASAVPKTGCIASSSCHRRSSAFYAQHT